MSLGEDGRGKVSFERLAAHRDAFEALIKQSGEYAPMLEKIKVQIANYAHRGGHPIANLISLGCLSPSDNEPAESRRPSVNATTTATYACKGGHAHFRPGPGAAS